MAYSNHVYPDHAAPSKEKNGILSQVKIGDIVYLLKDSEARAALDAEFEKLTAAAYTEVGNDKTEVKEDGAKLLTGKAVYDYVTTAISDLAKAIVFRGVAKAKPENGTVAMSDNTTLTAAIGDMVIFGVKEYIYDGSKWIELGDETLYLTKDAAAKNYVAKTFTIAGIKMDANIEAKTLAEALAAENKTAMGLGAMAYVGTGTASIETADDGSVSAATAGTYNVENGVVSVPKGISSLPISTIDSIAIDQTKGAAVVYSKPSTLSAKGEKAVEGKPANYTPNGTVTLPNLKANVTAATNSFKVGATDGEAYKIATPGSVTHAQDTVGDAVNASVSGEVLTLSAVKPVTAVGAIKYTAPTLSGSLPTFKNQTLATGIGSASASYEATNSTKVLNLEGEAAHLSAEIATWDEKASAKVTDATYSANITSTPKTLEPKFSGNSDVAVTGGQVTVAGGSKAVTINKSAKTITVSPSK